MPWRPWDRFRSAAFSMGAAEKRPLLALAKQAGVTTVPTRADGLKVAAPTGGWLSEKTLAKTSKRMHRLLKVVDEHTQPGPKDMSLARALALADAAALKDPVLRWALAAEVEFDTGGPLERLSASGFDEDEAHKGDELLIRGGFHRLLKPLAEGLDAKLTTVVTGIQQVPKGVKVFSNKGVFEGKYVVVAVPLGVLKAGSPRFTPPLRADLRAAIRQVPMGVVTKVCMSFRRRFWPKAPHFFGNAAPGRRHLALLLNMASFGRPKQLV